MKKYLFTLLFIVSVLVTNAQIKWEKLFSHSSTDVFRCVQEVPNNAGYIMAGYTDDSTANDTDAFVVRVNQSGDTLWTYRYNGPLSMNDLFYKIIVTSTGDFVAVGYSNSFSGTSDDVFYLKLNSSGQQQWVKSIGGSQKDHGQDIVETSDGYTVAAYTQSQATYYDMYVIHIDDTGDTLWTRKIGTGGANLDDANAILQLSDGGYILGGQSTTNGNGLDEFLVRTDSAGDTLWTKKFGTADVDNIESIALVSDGFILAGSTISVANGSDGYLVKTDTSGNVLWSKIIGGSQPDDFHRVEVTTDGGFILSGTTSSSGPANPNMWLVKTNSDGDTTWTQTFGGDNHDHGYSAVQTSDGYYIIAGHSGSYGFNNEEAYVVKTGPAGTNNPLIYITGFSLLSPTCADPAAQVKVQIRNFGNAAKSNIPVTVNISGAMSQTLTTIYTPNLAAHDVATVTFPATINSALGGNYTFEICTGIVNDVYPERNCNTVTATFSPCVGIAEHEAELGFSVYPNPVKDKFVIDFSKHYSNAEINIYSHTGELVQTFTIENTTGVKKIIDADSFAKGIYFLKVSADNYYDVRTVAFE